MPATEQTWRDSKLLHVVFGVTSLLMLIATIWMLAADHNREWKRYQRDFREVETWTAQSRVAQEDNEQYKREKDELEQAYEETKQEPTSDDDIAKFKALVVADAERRGVRDDFSALDADRRRVDEDFSNLDAAHQAIKAAPKGERADDRARLLREMNRFITDARFRESNLTTEKKYRAADFDVVRSQYEIAVGNSDPPEKLAALQEKVDSIREQLDKRTVEVQDAMTYRKELEKIVADITKNEVDAKKKFDDKVSDLARLEKAVDERQDNFGKELLELPILDAFGRPLKIEQIWLPKLTINYNFRDVARFDRCTTCHQGLDKSAPGSAVEPAYRPQHTVELELQTPAEAPAATPAEPELSAGEQRSAILKRAYGLQLANRGLLDRDDVTISVVRPESLGAKALLQPGDVIVKIAGATVLNRDQALRYLLDSPNWGTPLRLSVRRGLPHPYVSHPRLDLFVGSTSPHKMAEVGCTICHEGQGSATEFKWASHTPNDPVQGINWRRQHGWFNNHHWIFPMNPKRFAESSCLKCHHEVTELEPSEKFPDPPAPKLMDGYQLVRQFGCFGCHEINGFDGPNRRIGPDMRTEPNYAAASQALLQDRSLSEQQRDWASELISNPQNEQVRHTLLESLRNAPLADSPASVTAAKENTAKDDGATEDGASEDPAPVSAAAKKLATLLEDVETPGKLRKVGPSLRHVADKLDFDFLYSWVRRPKDFRPTTRMPQFFLLYDHLDGKGLEEAEAYEPLEIRGISEFLLAKSQPFQFAERPVGVNEKPSPERGKKLFETRGCLACHQHSDFPKATMNQGPDLSRIGAKLGGPANPDGPKWLYSWLRNPSDYHPRTLMPNVLLTPIEGAGKRVTDPAADIAAFLLTSRGQEQDGNDQGWHPTNVPTRELDQQERATLRALALESLKEKFPRKQANEYLDRGIPQSRRSEIKGDEIELVGEMSDQKQLLYVGRRAITKYGCSGCHDIPGFEDAKSIGTGLADWGRKAPDKLAFEQIAQYVALAHGGAHGQHAQANGAEAAHGDTQAGANGNAEHASAHTAIKYEDMDPTTGYFMQSLLGHGREGFIWQKLRAPRSFDYRKTQNKGYNERLRMPKFNLDEKQIDAVITFVLGLVAEPPAAQFVYKAQPRRQAIVEGLAIIEKYNCAGCHTLQMDRWKLAYSPDQFPDPATIKDYSFVQPHVAPQQLKASLAKDSRGLRHATITGMPTVNEQTGQPQRLDEDGAPLADDETDPKSMYSFALWDHAVIDGKVWPSGVQNLLVPESAIEQKYAAVGGFLPRLIYPSVVADEKKVNPNAKADEAWGWLPPPLTMEGRKVQTNWLYEFLLDPHPIRPAVVLRMPKFNLSPAEAAALVNYFAAVDGADYPYNFDSRTREAHLAKEQSEYPDRMQDALKVITDNNYCIKCHLIGDFNPAGSERAKAPRLDAAYRRLRPGFLRPWLANPKRLLPYTGMPVNIPFDKPVSQQLFHGDSLEQLDGLVDLLLNYDRFAESQTSIKPLIKAPPPATDAADNRTSAAAEIPQASTR